jgi:hypothetical protein
MRHVLALLVVTGAGMAQDAAAPKPEAQPKEAEAAAVSQSPVPTSESWVTGSVDVGYRWRTAVGGSFDSYRSVVDLGSGPKLLGADSFYPRSFQTFF